MKRRAKVALSLSVLLGACSNSTSGGLIQVPFAVGGPATADGGPLRFTTARGWSVTLDAAKIDLGPFYFNIDPPDTTEFRDGVVIVEALQQTTVDLLDASLVPVAGGAQGEIGKAVAAEIDLLPPDTTIEDPDVGGPSDTASAYLSGIAVEPDAGRSVPFQGWITIDQSLASTSNPLPWIQRVNGALCDLTFDGGVQSLSLRVDPSSWFDSADFEALLPTPTQPGGGSGGAAPDGGPYGWVNGSNFHAAVLGQIQQTTGVYDFTLSGGG
jgi:hypothetical protein